MDDIAMDQVESIENNESDQVESNENIESESSTARINNQDPRVRNHPEPFLPYCVRALKEVHPNILFILMGFLFKMIYELLINSGTGLFKDLCVASNYKTSKVSLKCNEAFGKSFVDMVQMTMFMMVNVAVLIYALLSSKLVEAAVALMVPFYYFSPLLANAPNVSVIFGTFQVPIFWFVFLCALVFSLLQGFVIFGVLFISWKLMH